ncbi:hypothetical protein ABT224_40850 [Streptomyces sp. NPDC001584]|uniref:hypothetical protein n=1 Tax=Streptomyces sp. NPDC001584 TaxID=3154521 RepID=UPI003321C59E
MDAEGHWTSTTRTSYDHRLECPAGGPEHLDTPSRLAKEGESLAVVRDPQGKVSPMAAGDVHGRGLRTAAVPPHPPTAPLTSPYVVGTSGGRVTVGGGDGSGP